MKVAENFTNWSTSTERERTRGTRKGRTKPLWHEMPTRAMQADPTRRVLRLGSFGVRARAGGRPAFPDESHRGGT